MKSEDKKTAIRVAVGTLAISACLLALTLWVNWRFLTPPAPSDGGPRVVMHNEPLRDALDTSDEAQK